MLWTTPIPIKNNPKPIDYHSRIFSMGSCFAVNIAEKFAQSKFISNVNPFGILFHPLAIDEIFHRIKNDAFFTESDIFAHNQLWQTYSVHSSLSQNNAESFLADLHLRMQNTKQEIQSASHVFITYGTSWVYRNIHSAEVVANCHKVPGQNFHKEILSVDVIEAAINSTISSILELNPSVQITFTISPVRHFKDGIVENQRSKSHLFAALHSVLENYESTQIDYFPSYEIVMDELRDYRFYSKDLLHPNQIAIDYIWERFVATNILPSAQILMNQIIDIQKALAHRPIVASSAQHASRLKTIHSKIFDLQKLYAHICFE